MSKITRPALRYYGGKWLLAPWIISHFPPHRIYVEPFAGAASVLLRKPRSYSEVYNDLECEVVRVFRVLRDPASAAQLELLLRQTPFAREELELAQVRHGSKIERARRTIVRSFMGFGSDTVTRRATTGFRSHSDRRGSTPAHDWVGWPDIVRVFTDRLLGVIIENQPALKCIGAHDGPETLFYIDPPYVHSTRRSYYREHGYKYEMSEADHSELAGALAEIEGFAVVSGYPSHLYESLYSGWMRVERPSMAQGAKPSIEVLWMNPKAESAACPLFASLENDQ